VPPDATESDTPTPKAGAPAAAEPEAPAVEDAVAEVVPDPRSFVYTWPFATVYQHIPLTAHPLIPEVPAVEASQGQPGRAGSLEVPATVFAFADPPDHRWAPTDLPVNQLADNEPAGV
jgi:hypothetical protein